MTSTQRWMTSHVEASRSSTTTAVPPRTKKASCAAGRRTVVPTSPGSRIPPETSSPSSRGGQGKVNESELFAHLPIEAEGVGDAPGSPPVVLVDRRHHCGTRCDGPLEDRVRVVDRQNHAHRSGPGSRGAGVTVRLDPEERPTDRELHDREAPIVGGQTVELECTEGGLVVVNRLLRITDGQPRRDIRIRCRTHGSL